MKPKFSIVIPTYNRAHYLKIAIETALQQRYDNFEVIVSDNVSSDSTPDLVRQYLNEPKFRYFRNETNLGAIGNIRKATFEHATGDWFLILSDDDYFVDHDYLQRAADLIMSNPNLTLLMAQGFMWYEQFQVMAAFDLPFKSVTSGLEVFKMRGQLPLSNYNLCNVIFPRHLALSLNAFDDPYNGSGDSELFYKCCVLGDVGVIEQRATVYRLHANNYVNSHRKNFDLLVHSALAPIHVYQFAQQTLPDTESALLNEWNLHVLVPLTTAVLQQLYVSHHARWEEALAFLSQYAPELIEACVNRDFFMACKKQYWKQRLLYNALTRMLGVKLQQYKHQRIVFQYSVQDTLKAQILAVEHSASQR